MTSQELVQFVSPKSIDKGVVLSSDTVEFAIQNNSPIELDGFWSSCGCLGTITIDGNNVRASLKPSGGGTGHVLFKSGDDYYQAFQVGKDKKLFNSRTLSWHQGDMPQDLQEVNAFKFLQSITLYFNDGEPVKNFNSDKKLQDNPNKLKVVVPVSFFYIQV